MSHNVEQLPEYIGGLNYGVEDALAGSDVLLTKLRDLIEREAKRAGVNPWFAQVCLVNGVDPLVHKRRTV